MLPTLPGQVLKIYKTEKDRAQYKPKLNAMLSSVPKFESPSEGFPQVTWPTLLAEDKSGNFIGYVMPEADFSGSKSLENMLQRKMRNFHNLPEHLGYRFNLAYNLSFSVAALHAMGHHIIDLKPVNCRIHPQKMFVTLVDSDGFSIEEKGNKRYPASQFTDEYICPEGSGKLPEELGVEQDLFALAVIIFRLLNNGLHPFQGSMPKGSQVTQIPEMIKKGYYGYGQTVHSTILPAPQSIHDSFPNELRKMFDQSFMEEDRPSAQKWCSTLRKYTDPKSKKILTCPVNSEHVYFSKSKGCGFCAVEAGVSLAPTRSRKKSTKKHATTKTTRVKPPPPNQSGKVIPLSSLTWFQSKTALWLVIASCLALFLWPVHEDTGNVATKTSKETATPRKETPEKIEKPLGNYEFKTTAKTKPLKKEAPRKKIKDTSNTEIPIKITKLNGSGFTLKIANLRTKPGTASPVLITLPKGSEIRIIGKVNGKPWLLVTLKTTKNNNLAGLDGFVHSSLIAKLK